MLLTTSSLQHFLPQAVSFPRNMPVACDTGFYSPRLSILLFWRSFLGRIG